ncbi:hypothetical protein TNCT_225931 [Trichonephila clavata]|uniref:Uncharacterized protein n=1 Tax=Trichonephila clavata TaxID=2740835 RepID=A0A8X6IX19_TRICU|nr:hypothetical protein TNCT_225931 [Trichonephila clavata]
MSQGKSFKEASNINCGKLVKRLKRIYFANRKAEEVLKERNRVNDDRPREKSLVRKTCLVISEKWKSVTAKSELDLFTTSPIQLAIDRSSFVEFHPVASISNNNTIEFLISGLGKSYFDLSHLFHTFKHKL